MSTVAEIEAGGTLRSPPARPSGRPWRPPCCHGQGQSPQAVNGRVESAVKLVLSHDVEPQADGSTLVGSSSDPLKTYTLTGQACTCQDFTHRKAPEGWCQHRIAAGIAKRVTRRCCRWCPRWSSPGRTIPRACSPVGRGAAPAAPCRPARGGL